MNMKIAWVVPSSPEGSSGGVQTVCRHAMHLQQLGAECHFFVFQIPGERDVAQLEQNYARYGCQGIVIHPSPCIEGDFQIGIATLFLTVPYVRDSSCREKFYFVQDFEPLFEPMGRHENTSSPELQAGTDTCHNRKLACFKVARSVFHDCVYH